MNCEYCDLLAGKSPAEIIYEDKEVVVAIKDLAITPGQLVVFPKEHFTILELVPEELLEKCAAIANKVGMVVFEGMGCQGTNILIQNGLGAGQKVPHFALDIIPRVENDGIDLQWTGKQLMEDEMETTAMVLKEELEKKPKAEVKEESLKEESKEIEKKDNKNNYLLKSLRKIP